VYHGERPPHRVEDPRCPEGDGWRDRSVCAGVSEADGRSGVRIVSDEANFVLRARREKLSALEEQGIAPFAYGFDRSHDAAGAVSALGDAQQGPPARWPGRVRV